jgi:uncharacterized protein (TIRG00374 family)
VWLGIAITIVALYFALRGVDLRLVLVEFRRANLLLLFGLSVPSYLLVVYFRALRWRHFTDPIQPMPTGALFRSVAVAFMANNLFPLRMGELVRCWYLSRETGARATSIFGTVILERVVDIVMVVLLALAVVWFWGGGEVWRRGVLLLVPVAIAPVAGLAWLRIAPGQVLGVAGFFLRPFSERIRHYGLEHLETFSTGLGALSGGSHLFWIGFHTLVIWLVVSTVPMIAGLMALGVDLGSPFQNLVAGWMLLAGVGIAVALPSAPGFFGVYHSACRLVLQGLGLPPEKAVALGTLLHAVFWISLTGLGLFVLRRTRTSLGELDAAAAGEPPAAPR